MSVIVPHLPCHCLQDWAKRPACDLSRPIRPPEICYVNDGTGGIKIWDCKSKGPSKDHVVKWQNKAETERALGRDRGLHESL